MQAIKKKLRSQSGASITFALLIFLVCAVVGSVVLAAGTAASGRMSRLAEMDQRYYSVNSAARLLTDLLDGTSATIVQTEQEGETTTYQDENGNAINNNNFDSIAKRAAYCIATGNPINSQSLQLKVGDIKDLDVQILETITPQKMILTVQSDDSANAYAMKLTFIPDVNKIVEDIFEVVPAQGGTGEDTQKVKTVTTWTITWSLQNNEILGSKRWKEAA